MRDHKGSSCAFDKHTHTHSSQHRHHWRLSGLDKKIVSFARYENMKLCQFYTFKNIHSLTQTHKHAHTLSLLHFYRRVSHIDRRFNLTLNCIYHPSRVAFSGTKEMSHAPSSLVLCVGQRCFSNFPTDCCANHCSKRLTHYLCARWFFLCCRLDGKLILRLKRRKVCW